MKDDPIQITDHLIEQHGADGALERVREGIETAHTDGDNYGLSVWREVSWILQKSAMLRMPPMLRKRPPPSFCRLFYA